MKSAFMNIAVALLVSATAARAEESVVRARATSPYHNIIVYDKDGLRTLSFDGTTESRVSLNDPLQGHFEYTEYFHTPWLWNPRISKVLMIGLGGASVQRSFEHYYPQAQLETAEIDPEVRRLAREFFYFKESTSQKVHLQDGRLHLRRSRITYDLIIADAYTKNRYGSSIPAHLVTREFFELANDRLATNGIMAYNIIGALQGPRSEIVGSVWRTMKTVFPEVYLFPARSSLNIVLVGVKGQPRLRLPEIRQRASTLVESGQIQLPGFTKRVEVFRSTPPPAFLRAQILTDDYAPVDKLLSTGR